MTTFVWEAEIRGIIDGEVQSDDRKEGIERAKKEARLAAEVEGFELIGEIQVYEHEEEDDEE